MKSVNLKKILPHGIAILIFLIAAAIMSKPGLQPGMMLNQSDVSGWRGMAQSSFNYAKEHNGYAPLWTTSMFSGMPTYNITYSTPWTPTDFFNKLMQLWLPKPMNFFFLACIGFYIFCCCVRIKPYVAVLGALAFAYSSFSPIIISAGHETQMLAIAYMPALLGAVLLIYQGKYLLGFALTAFFAMQEIAMNHQQISYYLVLVIGIMTISFLVKWIREKQWMHLAKALSLAVVAGVIGTLVSAVSLLPLSEFTKYSKRGGQLVLNKTTGASEKTSGDSKTKGLTIDYAFQWSYGKAETLTLFFPGVYGFGARGAELGEGSHVAKYLTEKLNQPEEQADQFAQSLSGSLYWGEQPFTVGPVYLGAVLCILALFSFIYLKSHHKWWILAACVFGILMSWGKNFLGFNELLFNYLPLYSKFRVPTMALVIPQLLFPILAAMGVDRLLSREDDSAYLWNSFKKTAIATGVIFVLAGIMYLSMDYKSENRIRTQKVNELIAAKPADLGARYAAINNQYEAKRDNQVYERLLQSTGGNPEVTRGIVNALSQDRQAIFGKDILRSLFYAAVTLLLLLGFVKNKMKDTVFLGAVALVCFVDLYLMDRNYLSEDSYIEADQYETQAFPRTEADDIIDRDKEPNIRVFNMLAGKDPFQESETSYYHNSIGGYSPAKIGIYDDLITYQLSGNPNQHVLNMLNTKYLIHNDPQTGKPVATLNPEHLGNCWIVKGVGFVNGAAAEMTALDNLNTKDSAVVDASFKKMFPAGGIHYDSTASIKLVRFDNEDIRYESNAASPQVAVFSEIYYPAGWNVYIDGKKGEYFKTNYVLRGMVVPAGKHQVEFKFEPRSYKYGAALTRYFSYIILLLLAAAAFGLYRQYQKGAPAIKE